MLLFFGSSHSLFAHDPPEEYYDRNVTVSVEPGSVIVIYRLELSQVSLFSLGKDETIQIGAVKGRKGLEQACIERFRILIPDQLVAFMNGKPLAWKVDRAEIRQARDAAAPFYFILTAEWKPVAGNNAFEIDDGNFLDAPGPYKLKIDPAEGIDVQEISEPREWTGKGIEPLRQREGRLVFRVASFAHASGSDVRRDEPVPEHEHSIWGLQDDNLAALLSTNYGLGLLLLIALVHGAGHSLMPGHGKTMVAAYLVGDRGTPAHAVLLGVVTTLTHTSAAIIIALLLHYVLPTGSEKSVNRLLMFGCGLMMFIVGLWLFLQRLAGRSDHVHLFETGHAHSHGGASARHAPRDDKGSIARIVLLGIAGGIIPCWGAIMWVVGCIATSQFWLALPVVLAFSLGLSVVLIAIGLSVVYAGRIGHSRWGQRQWFKHLFNERTVRIMPIIGAALVMAIGLWFCATSGIAAK